METPENECNAGALYEPGWHEFVSHIIRETPSQLVLAQYKLFGMDCTIAFNLPGGELLEFQVATLV